MQSNFRADLNNARDEVKDYLEKNNIRPKSFSIAYVGDFFSNISDVCKLLRAEPEIIMFVLIEWAVICFAYLAWVNVLQWIPDSVWNAIDHDDSSQRANFDLLNLIMLGWSIVIICAASFPIGLCNAAIVVAHNLRACGESSNFYKCLGIASLHIGRIWLFSSLDAWITVQAILRRLPKKRGRSFSAVDELLYYAWKIATLAVVPALVNGKDFIGAGKDSITLLKSHPTRVLGLRLGYSGVCWIIAILSYILAVVYYIYFGGEHSPHWIYHFYVMMAVPLFISIGIISVLIRPFFLLGTAKLYTDYIETKTETEKDIALVPSMADFLLSWKTILFFFLVAQIVLAVFFGDKIGWVQWIHHVAQVELNNLNG